MLILPERSSPRGKLLLPQRPCEWRAPSQRRVTFGIEDQTRWRLTGRLHDGHIGWRGWFDDREDADAFLFALVTGSLRYERDLWRLPTPAWHPDFGENLAYDFSTLAFLTATTGSNQTYTSASDWNNSDNSVETIGAGAGAGQIVGSAGGGGGGGAYSKIVNFSFASPGTTTATYQLGTGGAVNTAGGDSWFDGTTLGGSSVGAKGGATASGAFLEAAGAGGASASGIGTTKNSGGAGGNSGDGASGNAYSGGGGGGAGGSGGVGGAGGACNTAVKPGGGGGGGNGGGSAGGAPAASTGSAGGAGGNNASASGGGTGGAANGGAGGAASAGGGGAGGGGISAGTGGAGTDGSTGTEWDGTHGSGGGGGGGGGGTTGGPAGGNGGTYGGGGAGSGSGATSVAAGIGGQGIITLTYTPATTVFDMNSRGVMVLP